MVFTTAYSKNRADTLRAAINNRRLTKNPYHLTTLRGSAVAVLVLVGLLLMPTVSRSQGIIYHASRVDIQLSSEVQAAVESGIPLTFVCEYAMISKFLFIRWHKKIKSHQFVVKHHALSSSYLVSHEASSTPKIFRSMSDTMGFVAQQAERFFSDYHSSEHPYQMRVRLSKTELPGPMRYNAFVAENWDLNSGWKTWQSAQ